MQTSSQSLTRRHSFLNSGVFRGLVQLNDDRFSFLFFDQCDRFCAKFWLMSDGGLQIEIRQIYCGKDNSADSWSLTADLCSEMRALHSDSQLGNRILLFQSFEVPRTFENKFQLCAAAHYVSSETQTHRRGQFDEPLYT